MLQQYIKEFKTNLRLAWPVMLGMVGHTLVQFVDNVMVGQLGTTELAAISLGNGFSTAITPLIAEADASQNQHALKNVLQEGLRLCIILGVVLFLGVYIAKPILFRMGQEPTVV